MDIDEPSLMDVAHLNDTRELTPDPDGLKPDRGFDNGATTMCLMRSKPKLSRLNEGRKTISMGHRSMMDCCL